MPSKEDIEVMRHALGLDRQDFPYRNGFCVDNTNFDGLAQWRNLCTLCLAQEYDHRGGKTYFALTEAGAEAIGSKLPSDAEEKLGAVFEEDKRNDEAPWNQPGFVGF